MKGELMITAYKHIRNFYGKLIATKCYIQEESTESSPVGVGIAICSNRDNFSRKIGREIALKRAQKALLSKRDALPIRRENETTAILLSLSLRFKSMYWDINTRIT